MASALAAQPDDMSSVSGTHSVEGNSQLPRDSHMCYGVHTHTQTPHKNKPLDQNKGGGQKATPPS